jgi:hypothetical protein
MPPLSVSSLRCQFQLHVPVRFTEIGLIEGAILLAVGLAADRLRRQVGRGANLGQPEGTISDLERTAAEVEPSSSGAPGAPATPPSPVAAPIPPASPTLSSSEAMGDDAPSQPPDRPQSGARS